MRCTRSKSPHLLTDRSRRHTELSGRAGEATQPCVAIHEMKVERNQWIVRLMLQTTDPAEE
jgi:hypothetical protein